jgi:hypothetical protein
MSEVDNLKRRQEDALDRLRGEINLELRKYYRRLMAEGKAHIMAQEEISDPRALGEESFSVARGALHTAFANQVGKGKRAPLSP